MKIIYYSLLFVLCAFSLNAQSQAVLETGTVSFVSSKNIYVRFTSTQDINIGDTLFFNREDQLIPALLVANKSSSSTICTTLGTEVIKVDDVVVSINKKKKEKIKNRSEARDLDNPTSAEEEISLNNEPVIPPEEEDQADELLHKEKIKGRISVASYSNISNFRNLHRLRYAFSFLGSHLKNSRFSTESYITFRHALNDSITIGEALKVYKLNVKYEFSESSRIILGRKINPNFSSIGAIDGLQFEKAWGGLGVGLIAGARPDFEDYGLNFDLIQFGGYLSHNSRLNNISTQTTLGVVEQMNKNNTDRRFVYIQHSSTLAKGLNFFGSMEVDLFQNINNEKRNTTQLTNLYASLRYRINKKFRISAAYDNRRNVIYYESYKNFIDQLIEDETRQGIRLGFNHRVTKRISWGFNARSRFKKNQQDPANSGSAFVTFNNLTNLNIRVSLRANVLQTSFLTGQIYGVRLSKEIIPGKLSAELNYRNVFYEYNNNEYELAQNIAGANINMLILKRLSLHLYYEGTLDNASNIYHRANVKLIRRF